MPYSGSVQKDYMQISVVFIPVEFKQRWSFSLNKGNKKLMPVISLRCRKCPHLWPADR